MKKKMAVVCLLFVGMGILQGEDASPRRAAEIMRRVAEAQDRVQKERTNFLYDETIHVTTRFKNGKVAREEWAEFAVVPTASGTQKKQQKIHGRYWQKGHYVDFSGEPIPSEDTMDAGLISSFRSHATDEKSKDGLAKNLFPLTSEEQKGYQFELTGETVVEGRKAYRLRFRPADEHEFKWSGEAIIDQEEFQPVSVYSRMSRRLPFFVRTMLGTDVPGLGFSTKYARIDKDIWFPVSFGTEFRLHALFVINRTVIESMESKNFKRATAESHVTFDDQPPARH